MKTPAVKGLFAAVAAVVLALSAQATKSETPGRGMPLRGMVIVPSNTVQLDAWNSFSSAVTGWAWTDAGGVAGYIYDVGSPRFVNTLGIIVRDKFADRGAKLRVYGSNDGTNFSGLIFSAADTPLSTGTAVTNYLAREDSPAPAYRYYKATGDGCFDVHLLFFSDEAQLTQDRYSLWPNKTLGEADPETHHLTGKVTYLPSGGGAEVEVLVAATDHGGDYDAWKADPTVKTVSAGPYAQGEAWCADVTGLSTGKWYARAFAAYGDKHVSAQTTVTLLSGSQAYYPPMYHLKSAYNVYLAYNGNTSDIGNDDGSLKFAYFSMGEPFVDNEIVTIRYWFRSDTYASRVNNSYFQATASADLDFGDVIRDAADTAREVYSTTKEPNPSWTMISRLSDLDYWEKGPSAYYELPVSNLPRFAQYIRLGGSSWWYNWAEVEFRTVPRGPMPMATMTLGTIGGTYVGLEGFLNYRGYGCEGCEIYVSCVPEGSEPNYQRLPDVIWENQTALHASVTGLAGETHYVLNAIVSNVVGGAGFEVLSTSFTTDVAADEPPKVESVAVTPNADGSVTFSWNLVHAGIKGGTGATEADIYVQWGPDAAHLGERHLLKRAVPGTDSVVSTEVPLGEELDFVIVAVSTAGESEPSDPIHATTPGRSYFSNTAVIARLVDANGGSLKASGRIETLGLGTTVVYLVYGAVPGTSETWLPIVEFDASSPQPLYFETNVVPTVMGNVSSRLVASNYTETASWMTEAVACTNLMGIAMAVSASTTVEMTGLRSVCDGDLSTFIEIQDSINTPLVLDLGSVKPIQGLRLAMRSDGTWSDDLKRLVVTSSSDGKAYEPLWINGGSVKIAANAYTDVVFDSPHSARYLRFNLDKSGGYMPLAEVQLVGDALSIKANPPQLWAGAAKAGLLAKDDPEGIHVSGTIVSGGPAQVWAVAAPTDCGADLEAWRRAGAVRELGVFERGQAIAGLLPGAPRGLVYVKLLAVAGNESAVSPIPHIVPVGTKVAFLPMYVRAANSTGMQLAYDGNVGTSPNNNQNSYGHIFRLDPGKWDVKSVRLWPRSDQVGRIFVAVVDVSDDDVSFEATPLVTGDRPVFTYESSPAMTWRRAGRYMYRMDGNVDSACKDVPVALGRKARYLRVTVNTQNYNDIGEIEIRAVRRGGSALIVR